MNLEEARTALNTCQRQQLGDRETGAFEVYWSKDGNEYAGGWFEPNLEKCSVWFSNTDTTFSGDDARALRSCGASAGTEYMQPSPEEQEAASLERWAKLAEEHPYDPQTGGGIFLDIGGELYTGRRH